jgi:hypothetical protein
MFRAFRIVVVPVFMLAGCGQSTPPAPPVSFSIPSTPYFIDLSTDVYIVFANIDPESYQRLASEFTVPSLILEEIDSGFGKLTVGRMSFILDWLDGPYAERWDLGSEDIRALPYSEEYSNLRIGSVDYNVLGMMNWVVYDESKDLLFMGGSMDGEGWSIQKISELAISVYEK